MPSAVASHAGQPSKASIRSSTPVSFSIVTGLKFRATHDARYASTQPDWNRHGSGATTATATGRPSITRNCDPSTGTPSSHQPKQGDT